MRSARPSARRASASDAASGVGSSSDVRSQWIVGRDRLVPVRRSGHGRLGAQEQHDVLVAGADGVVGELVGESGRHAHVDPPPTRLVDDAGQHVLRGEVGIDGVDAYGSARRSVLDRVDELFDGLDRDRRPPVELRDGAYLDDHSHCGGDRHEADADDPRCGRVADGRSDQQPPDQEAGRRHRHPAERLNPLDEPPFRRFRYRSRGQQTGDPCCGEHDAQQHLLPSAPAPCERSEHEQARDEGTGQEPERVGLDPEQEAWRFRLQGERQ